MSGIDIHPLMAAMDSPAQCGRIVQMVERAKHAARDDARYEPLAAAMDHCGRILRRHGEVQQSALHVIEVLNRLPERGGTAP
jgi:hypothetical protein